jgi:hypothetical protein
MSRNGYQAHEKVVVVIYKYATTAKKKKRLKTFLLLNVNILT